MKNTCQKYFEIMVRLFKSKSSKASPEAIVSSRMQSFFVRSVILNDIATVKRLLKHHKESIDLEAVVGSGGSKSVHLCVSSITTTLDGTADSQEQHKSTAMLSVLLRAGADVDSLDERGWSCLHTAAHSGNLHLARYLMRANVMCYTTQEKKLPVDLSMDHSITFLLAEAMQQHGHGELSQIHLARAVAQQQKSDNDYPKQMKSATTTPPKHTNSILKRRGTMATLIKNEANDQQSRHSLWGSSSWSSFSSSSSSLLSSSDEEDLDCGLWVDDDDDDDENIRSSTQQNRLSSLSSCSSSSGSPSSSLRSSVSPSRNNNKIKNRISCISSSSSTGSTGSSVSRQSVQFSSNTLFLNYVHENEHQLLDRLLQHNEVSIINKLDRKGLSTIHWASINGNPESIRVLVKHGADVDLVDPNGWTALHAAVITGQVHCIRQLLACEANLYAMTNSGETVFDMTSDCEVRAVLEHYSESRFAVNSSSGIRNTDI